MAIQLRRGAFEDLNAQKMKPGEIAVVQSNDSIAVDGKAVYIAFQAGFIKRLATYDELEDYNDRAEAILTNVRSLGSTIQQVYQRAVDKANEADQSATDAATAKAGAEQAKADTQALLNQAQSNIAQYSDAAKESIDDKLAEAQAQLTTDVDSAKADINKTYQDRVSEINDKVDQIVAIKSNAEATASQALNRVGTLGLELADISSLTDSNTTKIDTLRAEFDANIHNWYVNVRNQLVAVDANGSDIWQPIEGIGGGSGGGGGGSTTKTDMKVTNTTGWLSQNISLNQQVIVTLNWYSLDNEISTGSGTCEISVNGTNMSTFDVQQGDLEFDLTNYIKEGTNRISIKITDAYSAWGSVVYTIVSRALTIAADVDTSNPHDGPIPVTITPHGKDISKVITLEVDDNMQDTITTRASDTQISYTIPQQSYGAHSLKIYYDADINGQTVRSNILYFEFMSIEAMNNDTIFTSSYNTTTVDQWTTVTIPYRAYTPNSETTDVDIYHNGVKVTSRVDDRTEQTYTFRATTAGSNVIELRAGDVSKSFTINVKQSDVTVEAETDSLALYLSAQGKSNNTEDWQTWSYGNIETTFNDITKVNDGWQSDDDNITVLRLTNGATATIPYNIFERDFKTTGKTIEFEFSTFGVVDYDAVVISCFADDIGFEITSQSIIFKGAQTQIDTRYKDNEHVRVTVVVEKQTENRLILIYINGVMSRAIQYASGERFSQLNPVGITLGNALSGLDVYTIRVYDNDLTKEQVLMNWIADTQVGETLIDRFTRNNIFDASSEITPTTLPKYLPYYILEAPELPQSKGDKKTIKGRYVDPIFTARSFEFEGCQINVQGTSSAPYFRKNYDMQFKSGFILSTGIANTYTLRDNSIPFNRFVLKADVASSESANNTLLTMYYNDLCPYKKPEQIADPRVRWGIEGIPIAVFWYNPDDQTTTFMGKYNFNLPKRAPDPLGYTGNMQSWEVERNNSDNVKFKDDDFTTQAWSAEDQKYYPVWYDDFEARMPSDEWRDYHQLQELVSWIKSTDRTQATNEALAESITYIVPTTATIDAYTDDSSYTVVDEMSDGSATGNKIITFTKDTPAYRLTKFRAELKDYMVQDSAVFYYIFTTTFTMIDSWAKNMFIGFSGDAIEEDD